MILNLKRQLRIRTISEIIFDDLESIRRVFGDFEIFDFLAPILGPSGREIQG